MKVTDQSWSSMKIPISKHIPGELKHFPYITIRDKPSSGDESRSCERGQCSLPLRAEPHSRELPIPKRVLTDVERERLAYRSASDNFLEHI